MLGDCGFEEKKWDNTEVKFSNEDVTDYIWEHARLDFDRDTEEEDDYYRDECFGFFPILLEDLMQHYSTRRWTEGGVDDDDDGFFDDDDDDWDTISGAKWRFKEAPHFKMATEEEQQKLMSEFEVWYKKETSRIYDWLYDKYIAPFNPQCMIQIKLGNEVDETAGWLENCKCFRNVEYFQTHYR